MLESLKSLTDISSLRATNVGNTLLANVNDGLDGFLGSHVDHSTDPSNGLPHVLNVILYYLQIGENYGGATLFFNKKGNKPISKVEYKKIEQ